MNAATRRRVQKRARNCCEYCCLPQSAVPLARFQIEHVLPRQHGGSDALANLGLACPRCNRQKGPNLSAVDPKSKKIVRLFNPRIQDWKSHFEFHGIAIVGTTAIGRATVRLLKMNAEDRLELRAALREHGELDTTM